MGLVAAAGKPAEEITVLGVDFDELHRGGWDPEARLGDQDRDGVSGEIIYPTVGMVLCNHQDLDYKHACMEAYNRWMAGLLRRAPRPALRRRPDGDAHARRGHRRPRSASRRSGFQGVMMPGLPGVEDYDSPDLRRVLRGGGRARAAAVVPHPHRTVRATPRPQDQRLHHHRAGLPGRDGHVRVRRRVRASPAAAAGVRRGRRRLGAPLPLPASTTPTSATATGCRTASSAACRASTSARTST